MLETYRQLTTSQYLAAMKTLGNCIEQCSDSLWNEAVGNWTFNQVAFHTLFFTDAYLGPNLDAQSKQPFHETNRELFAGYEELEKGPPTKSYERQFILSYFQHCIEKIDQVIASETEQQLTASPGFDWLSFSRAEVHTYNIRHIQHHAAQLSLHLRKTCGIDVPWFGVA